MLSAYPPFPFYPRKATCARMYELFREKDPVAASVFGEHVAWKEQHQSFTIMASTIIARSANPALLEEMLRPLGERHFARGVRLYGLFRTKPLRNHYTVTQVSSELTPSYMPREDAVCTSQFVRFRLNSVEAHMATKFRVAGIGEQLPHYPCAAVRLPMVVCSVRLLAFVASKATIGLSRPRRNHGLVL